VGLISYLDDIVKELHNTSLVKNGFWIMKSIINYPRAILADYKNNAYPDRKQDAVFLTASTHRQLNINGKYYDKNAGPFVGILFEKGLNSFTLEEGYRGDYRYPRYNKTMFIPPIFYYHAVKAILLKKIEPHLHSKLRKFAEFISYLEENTSELNHRIIYSLIQRVYLIRSWSEYFKKILNKVRPKIGFVVCYYGPIGMAFILACKESGVISIDIQHGQQGEYNIAYGKWNKIPENGFEVLPNYFWCWGKEEVSAIESWNHKTKNHRAIIGGNLLVNEFLNNESRLSKYYEIKIKNKVQSGKKNILLSLQLVHGLTDLFINAINSSPDNWFWWIRLHPDMKTNKKEVQKKLHLLRTKNWNISDATNLPLYALLKYMDVHVTSWSAVVLEAEMFGISSITTYPVGRDYFHKQISNTIVVEAYNLQDLIYAIDIQINNKKKIAIQQTTACIWDQILGNINYARQHPHP